jgi:hypothetical protein
LRPKAAALPTTGNGVQGGFARALVQYGYIARDGSEMDKGIRSNFLDSKKQVRTWLKGVPERKKRYWLSASVGCSTVEDDLPGAFTWLVDQFRHQLTDTAAVQFAALNYDIAPADLFEFAKRLHDSPASWPARIRGS